MRPILAAIVILVAASTCDAGLFRRHCRPCRPVVRRPVVRLIQRAPVRRAVRHIIRAPFIRRACST
jgi:hypothetical protein